VPTGVVDLDLWQLAVDELRTSTRTFAETFGGELLLLPGVSGVLHGAVPLPCWVYDVTADLRAVVHRCAGTATPLHVIADHPDQDVLREAGWHFADAVTEMVLLSSAGAGPPAPAGVVVEGVRLEGLDEFYAAMAVGFETSPDAPERWLPRAAGRTDGVQLLLARDRDGRAVGTAGLRRRGRGASLFAISVPPSLRGRGIGAALTAHAARAAFDLGAELVQLQASAAGLPVYERAGFRAAGHWAFYEPPRDS
jgi:GNAT superfamily N-acetyltransferase